MTWQTGREQIAKLVIDGEHERVTADEAIAQSLLDDAAHHLSTARNALTAQDLSGGYQLAYDA